MFKNLRKVGVQPEWLETIRAGELPFLEEMADLIYTVSLSKTTAWNEVKEAPEGLLRKTHKALQSVDEEAWETCFGNDKYTNAVTAFHMAAYIGYRFMSAYKWATGNIERDPTRVQRWKSYSSLLREQAIAQRFGVDFHGLVELDGIKSHLENFNNDCNCIRVRTIAGWIEKFAEEEYPQLLEQIEEVERYRSILPGIPKQMSFNDEVDFIKQTRRTRLKYLLAVLGALDKVASKKTHKQKQTRFVANQSVEYGDELANVFSSEFAQHKILFGAAFAEQRLLQPKHSNTPVNRGGDIFVFLDVSGSMEDVIERGAIQEKKIKLPKIKGDKSPGYRSGKFNRQTEEYCPSRLDWAICTILKLWEICCKQQGKTLHVIPYAGIAKEPLTFDRRRSPYKEQLLNMTASDGGTVFTAPVEKAFEMIESDSSGHLKELDFVFLTDAEGYDDKPLSSWFGSLKHKYKTRVAMVILTYVRSKLENFYRNNSPFVDDWLFLVNDPQKMTEKLSGFLDTYKK